MQDFNEVTWQMEHARLNKQRFHIPVTSLVFGNFCYDYYTCRFGLGFRLGFRLGVGLGLRIGLQLGVSFLGFISKCLHE